jgi:hypothetical protein
LLGTLYSSHILPPFWNNLHCSSNFFSKIPYILTFCQQQH